MSGARLDAQAVRAFLQANPEIVRDDPELIARIAPDLARPDGALDLNAFARNRLERRVAELEAERDRLTALAAENFAAQQRVHEAVLKLMDARDFEDVIQIAARGLAPVVGADTAALAVESATGDQALAGCAQGGVHVLAPGAVDRILPGGAIAAVRRADGCTETLYGADGSSVQSEAVIRLHFARRAPVGLLAFGSRDRDYFAPGQDTALLSFLAHALEASVRAWLDLPPLDRDAGDAA